MGPHPPSPSIFIFSLLKTFITTISLEIPYHYLSPAMVAAETRRGQTKRD
ncbi:hypothetical protein Hdeb2414_s0301g00861001 [Helianthus debilis subsp. tardiflorus]